MTTTTCTITFACKSGDQGQFEGTLDTHCLFGSCVPGFTTRIINPNHHLSPEEIHHFNQYHHRTPIPGSSAQQYTTFTYERRRETLRNKDEHENPGTSIPTMQSSDAATDYDDALADDSISLYTVPAFPALTPAAEQHAGQIRQSQIFHLPRLISHSSLLDTHRSNPSRPYLTLQELLFTPDALASPLTPAVQSSKSIPSPFQLSPGCQSERPRYYEQPSLVRMPSGNLASFEILARLFQGCGIAVTIPWTLAARSTTYDLRPFLLC